MRRTVLSLLLGLAVVAAARAQFPVHNAPYPPMGQPYVAEVPPDDNTPYVGPLWTINMEYLLWFLKPHAFQDPVIGTTTDPNRNLGGFVSTLSAGSPGYVNFIGPGPVDRAPYSGGRLSITRALPMSFDRCVHIEAAFLWLPQQDNSRTIVSTPDGNPAIVLPFRTPIDSAIGPAGDYSAVLAGNIADQRVAGSATAFLATQLWGGELNFGGPFYHSDSFGFEGLIGLRYLGIQDILEISANTGIGNGISTFDSIRTTCHFYGGQVGVRFLWSSDRWAAMCQTKVGLGDTLSNLTIRGGAALPATLPGARLPGGFYTAATNIGDSTTEKLSAVVDLNASLRFALSQTVGISVGYNYLFWNGIFRAADQYSNTLNPTYHPVLNTLTGATQTGPPEPRMFRDVTSFWAHGLNFGLDFRF